MLTTMDRHRLLLIVALLLSTSHSGAQEVLSPIPPDLAMAVSSIETREKEQGTAFLKREMLEKDGDVHFYSSQNARFSIRTAFDPFSATIKKNIRITDVKDPLGALVRMHLKEDAGGAFTQRAFSTPSGGILSFVRPGETFFYSQGVLPDGAIALKEWIHVDRRPSGGKLRYEWVFDNADSSRPVVAKHGSDGNLSLVRELSISGIGQHDLKKRKYLMDLAARLLPGLWMEREVARFLPGSYWTRQGQRKLVPWRSERGSLIFEIDEPESSYPLLIDPTLGWAQWTGGVDADYSYAMAVNGNEIYVGGYTHDNRQWEATMQGSMGGTVEGFVVEIVDGATPTVSWGQFLGTSANVYEAVYTLAVNGDEIYAGGYSPSTTGWEVTLNGTHAGDEGFVVELLDGGTPSIQWGQWIGGTLADYVQTVAVNGDEIYVGGYGLGSSTWEVAFQGNFVNSGVNSEGYVAELADGSPASVVWGQWLGGDAADTVHSIAVIEDSIYAGGVTSSDSAQWEIAFQGARENQEGFLVEILDGSPPSVNWGTYVGGGGSDTVVSVGIGTRDAGTGITEVYVAGHSNSPYSGWEVSPQGTHSGSDEVFVAEFTDYSGATYPSASWGQWIGGTSVDELDTRHSLFVNGNEIYIAGRTMFNYDYEVTPQGTTAGNDETFVAEVRDGGGVNWIHFIGCNSNSDDAASVVANGDNIYASFFTDDATCESYSSLQGTQATWELLTAKIQDDPTMIVNITGECKAFDQTTNCGDLGTIRVAVNGTLNAATDPNGGNGGTWALADVEVGPNDVVTVFVDGAADADEAIAVTKMPASGLGDVTGMKLFKQHLTIGGSTNQTITVSDLQAYDNAVSADEDIFHGADVASSCYAPGWYCVDKLSQFASERLYIDSGDTFAPGAALITALMDVRGTYTGAAQNLVLNGSGTDTTCGSVNQMPLCVNGGTVTFSGGVIYTGSAATTVYSGTYTTLQLNGDATFTAAAGNLSSTWYLFAGGGAATTFDLNTNDPTVSVLNLSISFNGTLIASSSASFTVSGNWENNGNFTDSGGTVTFNATTTGKTLTGQMTGTSDDFGTVTFNGIGGGWTLAGHMEAAQLNISNGTFNQGATYSISVDGVTVGTGGTWQNTGAGDVTLGGDVSNLGVITLDGGGAGCGDADQIFISGLGVARNWSGSGTFVLQDLTISDTGTTVQTALDSVDASNNVWAIEDDCTLGNVCGGGGGGAPGCTADGQFCTAGSQCCSGTCTANVCV